ncbi:ArsR/SmtB family transcription factor [Tumebacillus lipolyticus]|uniref:ArsR/SmtB family transcription factor n=1 Tax=Tumebacillus lipolyticus TaxID=1280370 RepID=A0ABW5A2V6_9BACL
MNQEPVYDVTSLDQMKALSNKVRVQILKQFEEEPRTSKQLADLLGLPASKVHYHVRELHKVGLLVLVETREKGGVVEKYYLPIAKHIRVSLQETDPSQERSTEREAMVMGRAFIEEYLSALEKSLNLTEQAIARGEQSPGSGPVIAMEYLHLLPEQQLELRQEIKEVLNRWQQRYSHQEKSEHTRPWRAFLSLFPD